MNTTQQPKTKKPRKTTTIQTAVAKVPRRVKMFLRRALREKDRGNRAYENSRNALTKAMQCGLQPGRAVEIEVTGDDGAKTTELFMIQDNFAGEVAFKKAYVSHYELTKVAKTKRVPNPEAALQPAEAAA